MYVVTSSGVVNPDIKSERTTENQKETKSEKPTQTGGIDDRPGIRDAEEKDRRNTGYGRKETKAD